jgi:hypothetical protein
MTATLSLQSSLAPRLTAADRKMFKGQAAEIHPWMNTDEVLTSIGCNFAVDSCIPTVAGREYPEARLWLRSDNGDHLGTFGNRRQVIQPGNFVEYFRDFCDKSGKAISLDVVGTPDKGKTFYMASKLIDCDFAALKAANPGRHFEIQKELDPADRTQAWLVITDYYGESAAPKALVYLNELTCYNGLSRQTHTKLAGLTHLKQQGSDNVAATILAALEEVSIYAKIKNRLIETKITPDFARNVINAFYRKPGEEVSKKANRIMEIYSDRLIGGELATRKGTAWGLLSAVTQNTTHGHVGDSPESRARAFRSSLDGPRALEGRRFADHLEASLAAV